MQDDAILNALKSQYLAGLKTMQKAIEACPADLWTQAPTNLSAFWRVAHHTVWFADLYLSPSLASFKQWPKHVDDHQHLGLYRSFKENDLAKIGTPTTQAEMIEFIKWVKSKLADNLAAAPLEGPSGFDWIRMNKFEAHLYNIRHIQHHAGHLVARLRELANVEAPWVGRGAAS